LTLIYTKEATISCFLNLDAHNNTHVNENYPFPFEVKFEPEQLLLKQQESKSVILTINADYDAPIDLYTTTIHATDRDKGMGATLWISVVE
jgi:uncharacterized membrane protein